MSAWMLFAAGLTVSLMCLAGLVFTIVEVRRLGREADERAARGHLRRRLLPRAHGLAAAAAADDVIHREGRLKVFHRSDYAFMGAAFISFLLSVYLWFSGQREEGLFVGLWVPSILSFGTLVGQSRRR